MTISDSTPIRVMLVDDHAVVRRGLVGRRPPTIQETVQQRYIHASPLCPAGPGKGTAGEHCCGRDAPPQIG